MHYLLFSTIAQAGTERTELWSEPGIWITVALVILPLLLMGWLIVVKAKRSGRGRCPGPSRREARGNASDSSTISNGADTCEGEPYTTGGGLIRNVDQAGTLRYLPPKKQALQQPVIYPPQARLILWYLGSATFWLLFGTTVGQYLGIKFVVPDVDQVSWLSFGRSRPVHTNAVFWGWASLAMLGLGYYVVALVGNVRLASIRCGWWTLGLLNVAVTLGSLSLMAGINNGGG